MQIGETTLEQVYTKLASFTLGLSEKLTTGKLTPSELPIGELQGLINANFISAAVHFDITSMFRENISVLFSTLQTAMNKNDTLLTAQLLHNLLLTLQVFVYQEKNLQVDKELENLALSCAVFSHEQYDNHIAAKLSRDDAFKGKGVVYTAVTGGYDQIHLPEYIDPALDYICFTDKKELKSDVWQIRQIENPLGLDNIRLARHHKILCENYVGDYDYSIWVDGKIKITGDLLEIIRRYHLHSPLLCFSHYERDCIYQEADVCKSMGKGNAAEIDHQITKYKSEDYPEHNGLVDTCVLFRSHGNDSLNTMLSAWWHEVETESVRDQLSFNYACNKTGFEYDLCNLYLYGNPYFVTESHG